VNAHQRRKLRRNGDHRGYRVEMCGYVRMMADEDPEIIRPTGQLYENTTDGKLRVSINGEWFIASSELDAKRKVQNWMRVCDWAKKAASERGG
jgi:hypothetical protein